MIVPPRHKTGTMNARVPLYRGQRTLYMRSIWDRIPQNCRNPCWKLHTGRGDWALHISSLQHSNGVCVRQDPGSILCRFQFILLHRHVIYLSLFSSGVRTVFSGPCKALKATLLSSGTSSSVMAKNNRNETGIPRAVHIFSIVSLVGKDRFRSSVHSAFADNPLFCARSFCVRPRFLRNSLIALPISIVFNPLGHLYGCR